MKTILLICGGLLLFGIARLPIGYYTFLRVIVTIVASVVLLSEWKSGINFWVVFFGLVAIIFNPIIPVHLNDKAVWMPIDLVCGIVFIVKAFNLKTLENEITR